MQLEEINSLFVKSLQQIQEATDLKVLEDLRITYLGKQGSFTELSKQLKSLDKKDLPIIGKAVNQAKGKLTAHIGKRKQSLLQQAIDKKLLSESIDVSLPAIPSQIGKLHPITQITNKVINFFTSCGFAVATGPEIEDDYHNFTALNIPDNHPARAMHDTFYMDSSQLTKKMLLRTHTSSVQVRVMKNQEPPIKIIAPGRVYRCDSDITHTPMFHQLEGLYVAQDVSLADLKGIIASFLRSIFATDAKIRYRPSYFPFTEPSMEVDIGCMKCNGKGCRICKGTGWLEIMGCGLVHPQVLQHADINTKQFSGYAFGIGIERLAMLMYKVSDLRTFFENNTQFLKQF